jgi:chromosome segregation ATPase
MDTKNDAAEIKRKIAEIKQHVDDLQRKTNMANLEATRKTPLLSPLKASITQTEQAIKKLQLDLSMKEKTLEVDKKKAEDLEKEIKELTEKHNHLKGELDEAKQDLMELGGR